MPTPNFQPYQLSDFQRDLLIERVDIVLEDTEDWQLSDDEYQKAIQSWIDILKQLKADKRVVYWIKEYNEIDCEVS